MNITVYQALDDYMKLCKTDPVETSRIGNKAMNYHFFTLTLRTKTKRGQSFDEFLESDEPNKPYYKKFIDKRGNTLKAKYDAFQLYSGSINCFKPIIAKKLYQRYNPTTILDFCAGWGGRCIAAMACDINYIGFDTNIHLKEAYEELNYPTTSKVEIHIEDSSLVDYSQYTYDMVFTSPPYFKTRAIEVYEGMPDYKNRNDFNESFLFPVIENTYAHLSKGGIYALNIPLYMYDDIKNILGECNTKIPLKISKRSSIKKFGGEYSEYIYVWLK